MVVREISVERIAFTCGGCGHRWSGGYDVQHAEDDHGDRKDYYFYDGAPVSDPWVTGSVACPRCGRSNLWVELAARRVTPVVTSEGQDDLGAPPSEQALAARRTAPRLSTGSGG